MEKTLEQVLCTADPAAVIRAELVLEFGPVFFDLRPFDIIREYSFTGTPEEIRNQLKKSRREYFLEQIYSHIGMAPDGDVWRLNVSAPAADPGQQRQKEGKVKTCQELNI